MRSTFLLPLHLLILTKDVPRSAVLERTGSLSLTPEQGSFLNF